LHLRWILRLQDCALDVSLAATVSLYGNVYRSLANLAASSRQPATVIFVVRHNRQRIYVDTTRLNETALKFTMKSHFIASISILASLIVQSSNAASSWENGISQIDGFPDLRQSKQLFKKFLANPYPVKSVRFNVVRETEIPGKLSVSCAEGSLQNGTFYLQYTGDRNDRTNFFLNSASGMSSNKTVWSIDNAALIGVGGHVDLGLPKATAVSQGTARSSDALRTLRNVCWFGQANIVPETLRWQGETDFFTVMQESPSDGSRKLLKGEIISYSNNLPTDIRLVCEDWPKSILHSDTRYEYGDSNAFTPTKIMTEVTTDRGSYRGQWFDNVQIHFGSGAPEGGFKPADFLPVSNSAAPMVIIASNNGVYWARPEGLVATVGSNPSLSSQSSFPWKFAIMLLVAIVPLVIFLRQGRPIPEGVSKQ
jgi:hypothetical protein